ncbi:hypothetical protein [Thiorhodovibrio frisius]|uniref:Uncharacterized protein n=1 Tax=Thiorhodovibrio frisius TaxID=631362 RepID=H8YXI9_9GAMM|nr:hypothetical protein [Thiorhodovibrio frisius]EIC23165.1 hypothetical protein Thi970DRAFT_00818 [Thiorhodovibrio frisius]WPL22564.1 hypothetical protein Thiofri_02731 [Thiorhodovibrio frisius]
MKLLFHGKTLHAVYLTAFLLALALGLLSGYGRLLVWFFLPGIQGMIFGGVLGSTLGSLLARRRLDELSFSRRLSLVAGLLLAFYGGQMLIPAFVLEGWDPFFLIGSILEGSFREVMTGGSVHSFTMQQGPLTPPWWIFFQLLDALFFFLSALIGLGVGLGRSKTPRSPWVPVSLLTCLLLVVLGSTRTVQAFHAELLKDWHIERISNEQYLAWRDQWATASLRPDAVERFLEKTAAVSVERSPQLAVLRGLGELRMGRREAAGAEFSRAREATQGRADPLPLDRFRRIGPQPFLKHLDQLERELGALPVAPDSSGPPALSPMCLPKPGELFPFESVLLNCRKRT